MAAYPLEFYLVAAKVEGLEAGVYKYDSDSHEIRKVVDGNTLQALYEATFDQDSVRKAAAVVAISAVYERTRTHFGDAADRFVHMDLGHASQNLHLQAVALSLCSVVIGAIRPAEVKQLLQMPEDEEPLYLIPIGQPT
jgi:SagB-type dehydrogenase family enzyme